MLHVSVCLRYTSVLKLTTLVRRTNLLPKISSYLQSSDCNRNKNTKTHLIINSDILEDVKNLLTYGIESKKMRDVGRKSER